MSITLDTLQSLKTLRDTIKVRVHLLGLELKEEWDHLETRFAHFEADLVAVLADFGKYNEEHWVGSQAEIDSLIKDMEHFKNKIESDDANN